MSTAILRADIFQFFLHQATVDKGGTVTLQELVVSSLAQTDTVAKLLIEKGVITQGEFMEKIKAERAMYQAMFRQKGN